MMLAMLAVSVLLSSSHPLTLEWDKNWLTIHGEHLPGKKLHVHYLEAYCRANSTDADWLKHTVVGHKTILIDRRADGTQLKLRCELSDGVTMDHVITAEGDAIDFRLTAHNPTKKRSEAHWAQPCVRVGTFAGAGPETTEDDYAYVPKCFIFLDGKLTRLPTEPWAKAARYTPGQVWRPRHVPASDVNPRPVSQLVPSNGLIGCFSGDEKIIFATAWEPYQELFQGVGRCLHSDFRLEGLEAGQSLQIRGKIYLVKNDVKTLLDRYGKDFPEHRMK
jgi:hypothetical protein